jgi:DNA primase
VRFDDRFLDEIKSRLRLSDVIGKTVKLRRQGREYAGLSPFTKEKSPSFFVNDDKGFYHCFSSGKHGDLISFLQETERLSFMEAVERLAAEAGVPLPAQDPQAIQREKQQQSLTDWLVLAAAWYEAELRRPVGSEARAYLDRRGLPEADRKRFGIGYAPAGRTALKDYLVAKGAQPRELVEAGLLIAPEDGGAPYDRFRDRIMFPITDPRGKVVSFGGRALDPQARAKYLNGPETDIFHKGDLLYGLFEARKLLSTGAVGAASTGGPVDVGLVVVEGYMDVIACQRAGIAAVAPMGTALTEQQMERLWRLHPEPTLCFDGDGAGQRAAARSIERALPLLKAGRSLRFAMVTGGKDPDDVLREQGAAALKAQLSQTVPFVEALFALQRDAEPLDTPERRAGLKARLRAAAATIQDKDLSQEYRNDLLRRVDGLNAPAQGASGQGGYGQTRPARAPFVPRKPGSGPYVPPLINTQEGRAAARRLSASLDPLVAAVAQGALLHPDWLDPVLEVLQVHGFGDQALDDLAKEIIRLRLDSDVLDTEALTRHLASVGFSILLSEIDKAALNAGAPFLNQDASLADARSQWSHAFDGLIRMAALERALLAAKSGLGSGDDANVSDAAEFMRLKLERDGLRRAIKTGTFWTDVDP